MIWSKTPVAFGPANFNCDASRISAGVQFRHSAAALSKFCSSHPDSLPQRSARSKNHRKFMENEGTMVEEGLVPPESTPKNDTRPRHFPPNKSSPKRPKSTPKRPKIYPKGLLETNLEPLLKKDSILKASEAPKCTPNGAKI